jgi:hypothetical protein
LRDGGISLFFIESIKPRVDSAWHRDSLFLPSSH